ncbi:MAG: F0F1 ATP synthase subunit epsilon [Novosphingobium sp.]|nr:F0F1 ATP synthase subunit epsilon [Novosphingobium sp.]
MSAPLRLTIATPAKLVIACDTVRSLRAADASGGFGVQPGHADLLTVLPASVVHWRTDGETWRHCAVRAGVLRVSGGNRVAIAAREAVLSDDLTELEAAVHSTRVEESEADRCARVEQAQFHTYALRQLLSHIMPEKHVEGFPAARDGGLA